MSRETEGGGTEYKDVLLSQPILRELSETERLWLKIFYSTESGIRSLLESMVEHSERKEDLLVEVKQRIQDMVDQRIKDFADTTTALGTEDAEFLQRHYKHPIIRRVVIYLLVNRALNRENLEQEYIKSLPYALQQVRQHLKKILSSAAKRFETNEGLQQFYDMAEDLAERMGEPDSSDRAHSIFVNAGEFKSLLKDLNLEDVKLLLNKMWQGEESSTKKRGFSRLLNLLS